MGLFSRPRGDFEAIRKKEEEKRFLGVQRLQHLEIKSNPPHQLILTYTEYPRINTHAGSVLMNQKVQNRRGHCFDCIKLCPKPRPLQHKTFGDNRGIAWETRISGLVPPLHSYRVADGTSVSELCDQPHETNERDSHDEIHGDNFYLTTMKSFPLQEIEKSKWHSRWVLDGGHFRTCRRTLRWPRPREAEHQLPRSWLQHPSLRLRSHHLLTYHYSSSFPMMLVSRYHSN